MTKSLLALAVVCCSLIGCVYQNDDDVWFESLEPPDGSDAGISIGNLTEPIGLYQQTDFQFSLQPPGREYYNVVVTMDSKTVLSVTRDRPSVFFTLDPADYGDGIKTLSIRVMYPTNSPSLAGRLGAEVIVYTRNFEVLIDKTPPDLVPAPEVYIEDGRSMIRWEPPAKYNFTELVIHRTYESPGPGQSQILKVADLKSTVYHDASYVGGKVRYKVALNSPFFQSVSEETEFEAIPIKATVDSLADPFPKIAWTKPILYNNNLVVNVKLDFGTYTHPITEAGDQEIPVTLGNSRAARVEVFPVNDQFRYTYGITKHVYKGIKIPPFNSMAYHAGSDKYIFLDDDSLKLTDAETFQLEKATLASGRLLVTPDGQDLYLLTGSQISRIDPLTLVPITSFDILDIPGTPSGIYRVGDLTDDHLLVCQFNNYDIGVLDLDNQIILWSDNDETIPLLSSKGDYMCYKGSLYKRNGQDWNITLGSLSDLGPELNIAFRQDSRNQMFVQTYTELYTYDLDEISQSGIFSPETTRQLSAVGQRILYQSPDEILILNDQQPTMAVSVYNANTFDLIARDLGSDPELNSKLYYNGHFFHVNGYYQP